MFRIAIGVALAAGFCASCGVSANPPLTSPPPVARAAVSPQYSTFAAWRIGFRGRAMAAGVQPAVFDRALSGVTVSAEVVRLDGAQAEFTKPIWEYLDGATSADRVSTGRAGLARREATLDAIEARYGVDREIVLAIWGMESSYGGFRGSIPVVRSLATLAYDGRRREFGEEQLIAALLILQAGDATPAQMVGSWAGAMGHTQFVPTSYLNHAVDFNGDGRRDVWSDDPTDALASTANYLRANGWVLNQPWGIEVRLPEGFDYAVADQANRRPVADWRSRRVTRLDGSLLPDHGNAAILAPAGARGPAFAVYDNFFVIKTYNNATSYAMGVGYLGDRIMGRPAIAGSWPRGERELSRSEKIEMQERLTARGYDTGATDGMIGPNTIAAVRAFQLSQGLTPDGFATTALLARLR